MYDILHKAFVWSPKNGQKTAFFCPNEADVSIGDTSHLHNGGKSANVSILVQNLHESPNEFGVFCHKTPQMRKNGPNVSIDSHVPHRFSKVSIYAEVCTNQKKAQKDILYKSALWG